jgi:hypothetical protein
MDFFTIMHNYNKKVLTETQMLAYGAFFIGQLFMIFFGLIKYSLNNANNYVPQWIIILLKIAFDPVLLFHFHINLKNPNIFVETMNYVYVCQWYILVLSLFRTIMTKLCCNYHEPIDIYDNDLEEVLINKT